MNTTAENDNNYLSRSIIGGSAADADSPVLGGGGADLPADTPTISGGNAGTRHLENSSLSKEGGFRFPKGLPTPIKLMLHKLLDEQGVTADTLPAKASELADQLKPTLEQRYDFVVNRFDALVEQVKADATSYLAAKS